jgi:hypothetical protein
MNQIALALLRIPERGTQHYDLLAAFKRGERLTVLTAIQNYGVYALSQRCGELKRQGWPVKSETKSLPNGKSVSEYWME